MKLPFLLLLAAPSTLADEPPLIDGQAEPTQDEVSQGETQAEPLDPAVVTWYQDMRLACSDKRTSIVSRYQASNSLEAGALVGNAAWSAAATGGVVSWQAANDPRVDDRAQARTPDMSGPPTFTPRLGSPSPELYPSLPADVTGRLQAIELAQGQADTAWRAWQEQPGQAERQILVGQLEVLQGLCAGAD